MPQLRAVLWMLFVHGHGLSVVTLHVSWVAVIQLCLMTLCTVWLTINLCVRFTVIQLLYLRSTIRSLLIVLQSLVGCASLGVRTSQSVALTALES